MKITLQWVDMILTLGAFFVGLSLVLLGLYSIYVPAGHIGSGIAFLFLSGVWQQWRGKPK